MVKHFVPTRESIASYYFGVEIVDFDDSLIENVYSSQKLLAE